MDAVVIQSGSLNTRAGYAGEQIPKVFIPTASEGEIKQPIRGGVVSDVDGLEKLWSKVFASELKVQPDQRNVLVLVSPNPEKAAKEKIAELMLEKFNVKGFYIGNGAVTSLYAVGKLDGVVLQSGDGVTHAVPVSQGYAVQSATTKADFGGDAHTQYLARLLGEKATGISEADLRSIKAKMCYVAKNFDLEESKSADVSKTFALPDGKEIVLGSEMFQSSEIFFNPGLGGIASDGVAAILKDAITKCPAENQQTMSKNIVLGGGATLLNGFPDRLAVEMKKSFRNNVDVTAATHRLHSSWLGGSILAAQGNFATMWVTAAEYSDKGMAIVHEKCK